MRACRLLIVAFAWLILATPADAAITRGWAPTQSMSVARTWAGSVILDDGRVLVAGGQLGAGAITNSAEIWDPATGTWSPAGSMTQVRFGHNLVKLPNGRVLAAGGSDGGSALASAELYDPATGAWEGVGAMPSPHHQGEAVLLASGDVLVAGGLSTADGSSFTSASATFHPGSKTWSSAGTVPGSLRNDAAMVRAGNQVMFAGGYGVNGFSAEAAIYENGGWRAARPLGTARNWIALAPLPGGRILASGGATASATYSSVAEIYDPQTDTWASAQPLAVNHFAHRATALANGKVLVSAGYQASNVGATTASELFDPVTGTWTPAGTLSTPRWLHTDALLPDGRVLVAGGSTGLNGSTRTATAEIWTPTTSLVSDPALAFGALRTGTGASAGVQITNTGDSPLLTADFAIAGINPDDFAVNGDRCRVVTPGATCALAVRFAPTALGTRSATLTFSTNTPGGVHAVPLSGTATADTDGDGVLDGTDRCERLKGSSARQGCPAGLLADPSIRYRSGKRSIRVIAYYVKATKGARVNVSCSKGCKRTATKGKGSKRRVRITRLNQRRLKNGATITVTVSLAGRLTTTVVDRISRGRRVEGRATCTQPGTKGPRLGC